MEYKQLPPIGTFLFSSLRHNFQGILPLIALLFMFIKNDILYNRFLNMFSFHLTAAVIIKYQFLQILVMLLHRLLQERPHLHYQVSYWFMLVFRYSWQNGKKFTILVRLIKFLSLRSFTWLKNNRDIRESFMTVEFSELKQSNSCSGD